MGSWEQDPRLGFPQILCSPVLAFCSCQHLGVPAQGRVSGKAG